MDRLRPPRVAALVVALGLLASACSSSKHTPGSSAAVASQINAEAASVDLYAGAPQRFIVGLLTSDQRFVSFGTVGLRFAYMGTAASPGAPRPGPQAQATYVPTPGTPDGAGSGPTLTQPSEARGVYQAEGVTFDRAGIWQVQVSADVRGVGRETALASFQVADSPSLPAPGQPALRTDNLTIHSKGVPRGAIDSRATIDHGKIPDPELHQWTIAKAIAEHRPAVVVFSTPVFCVSRFCGPVTDLIDQISKQYSNRAVFIHVEIWRDFQNKVVNKAAADWLYRNGDLTEPWIYLIGSDGIIKDRWITLVSRGELVAELRKLPVMS